MLLDGGVMITTGEARRIAETWLLEEAPRVPEFVGAILAGSTRARDPETPHPPASDVDIFLWVDAEVPSDIEHPRGPFAPRKLLRSGVVLEPSFHDARRIADPEAVLGDVHLGAAFADPLILLDPAGRLAAVAHAVGPEYSRRRHVRRRLAQALGLFEAVSSHPRAPDLPALAPCWRNVVLALAGIFAAIAPQVAALRFPTVRRSLVVARQVLAESGRDDLADALLRLAGSAALSRAEVEERVAELWPAYDAAVEVRRTPVVMDWNVSREARALECAAIAELVDEGHHREAACPLLQLRTVVQGILENDGDEKVRAWSRAGYGRLLASLGIESDDAFDARAAALQAFVPDLRKGCEDLLARNPAVHD
jgi:hypothetical protein